MNRFSIKFSITLFIIFCASSSDIFSQNSLRVTSVSCNHFDHATGVLETPVFGWKLVTNQNDQSQTAYQIIVSSTKKNSEANIGDIWDSKKIVSADQINIPFGGKALESSANYYFKVKVWDKNDQPSTFSKANSFITGLVNAADFKANWITSNKLKGQAAPLFRKSFLLKEKPQNAIIQIAGLGFYELYINGKKVGDHVLDPGQTNYEDYAFYVTYNIDSLLKDGENVIGLMLGDGWYNQDVVWGGNLTYGKPMLWCQLDMKVNGSMQQILSDTSWKFNNGPILSNNVYAGEVYDANKEIEGWCSPSLNDANWKAVSMAQKHPPILKPQNLPPIKKMQTLAAKKYYKLSNGNFVFDMGQNFAGWNRLKIIAPKGTIITMKMAEEVVNDTLDYGTTGINATYVIQTEKYICKGSGTEIWEPRFTYHGFRYVEVNGLKAAPAKDLLTGIVVYSSMVSAGNFNCANPQINKLHQLSYWTLISNLHSIPTDCPAREKCGWLGDSHAVAQSSIYNMDMQNFWLKYLDDIHSTSKPTLNTVRYTGLKEPMIEKYLKPAGIPTMVAPGKRFIGAASPDWGTAIVQLPWFLYKYYGNIEVLKKFYPDMKQWVNFVGGLAKKHIVYIGLGDWCPPGSIDGIDCPIPLSSTAFHYNDLMILKQVAAALGNTKDSKDFGDSALLIRKAFISKYYDVTLHSFGSHTANAMALDFGLVPVGDEALVANAIVITSEQKFNGFMYSGIFGLQRLFDQLSKHQNEQAAFNMLDKKGDNSFELMWKKYHATTLWEVLPVSTRFVTSDPNILNERSHSHPMQAGFDTWFFNGIAGINPDMTAPGFKKIILEPKLINQLKFAKGDYNSVYGKIVSDWKWEGKKFVWTVEIPVNTTATIKLPNQFSSITINKKQNDKIVATDNGFSRELTSGKYQLVFH